MKVEKNYVFTGFGFDVVILHVVLKTIAGEEYPDINMNELKINTAKSILLSDSPITGIQLVFLRSMLKYSPATLSGVIDVPASTIALWEKASKAPTGLSVAQERVLSLEVINNILGEERDLFSKKLGMVEKYSAVNSGQVELKLGVF
jgi:DNA-binding transcriptional regulator YiaG